MCVMYSLFKACNIIMESEAVLLTYITSEYSVWPYLIHIIYKNQDVHLSIFTLISNNKGQPQNWFRDHKKILKIVIERCKPIVS